MANLVSIISPATGYYGIKIGSAPAMAVLNNRLYIAFQADDPSHHLFITSSSDGVNFTTPATDYTGIAIGSAPAMAVLNNRLYIAFQADDPSHHLFITSSGDGVNFTTPATDYTGIAIGSAPAMAVLNNRLYIAFQADDPSHHLFITSSSDGVNFTTPATDYTGIAIGSAPAMTVLGNDLYIAFQGDDPSHHLFITSSSDGANFTTPATDYTGIAIGTVPAMGVFQGLFNSPPPYQSLFVAFQANDPSHVLYVASSQPVPWMWMSKLPDSAKLSQLTLPGTHDSCTKGLIPNASSQSWSLADQLNHGIRYVDIRCRQVESVFAIHHAQIFTGLFFGDGVRDVCVNFLKANPTECIVMEIKSHEYGDDNPQGTFEQVLDGYIQGFESFFYLDNYIPTLGQVRGKIVVVRRFDLDDNSTPRGLWPDPWQDDTTFDDSYTATNGETVTFHIQDQYIVPTLLPRDISAKWSAISALLDRAGVDQTGAWYVNFTSGNSNTGGAWPSTISEQINPKLWGYLGGAPFPNRLGTLVLDFPDDYMIWRIITLNTWS